jgi:hypothetical protein
MGYGYGYHYGGHHRVHQPGQRRHRDSAVIAKVGGGAVDVPKDPSNDVMVTTPSGQRIGIGIPNGDTARDARTTASGTTAYTDPASNSATAVQATTDGVRQLFTLNNADAPTDFTVPLTSPDGAVLNEDGAGGYDLNSSPNAYGVATTIVHIDAPWAKDATGKSLATSYSIKGTTLTQHIATTGAVFPVVADPLFTYGWGAYFNLTGSQVFTLGSALMVVYGGASIVACNGLKNVPAWVGATVRALCNAIGGASVLGILRDIVGFYRTANFGACYQTNMTSSNQTFKIVSAKNCA